jgi:glutamate racemase
VANERPIGVFDSGLGGLTVVKEIIKELPNEDIIYFGDTGRVPYGTRSVDTIKKYALEDERFLLSHGVKLIVAACGTVSSVAGDTAKTLPVPFFEVVSHAAREAAKVTRNGKIAVIGTNATIKSEQHKAEILKVNPNLSVINCACPLFVPLVEEGWHDADDIIVLETVKRYLQPIIDFGADTLIMGCTHYPVLEDAIAKVLGDGVTLINAGTTTAKAVADYLKREKMENQNGGTHKFFVSDKPGFFQKQASVLLGEDIETKGIEKVDISKI